ncbi:glycosyltransferase family 2 protein [Chitinophaga sp. sic0106]|uniref:glycosyltransferase family 2 protein n=1 Tax=Chitinophaga sp. sic0106 TaxID=2854785 RepID=UPI001C473944|nr:glycosyltransferase family 2 protein [Chitinophaga sp. sic0106]MBV7532346.1 glycosyltransferase family 2 protein [Chitinophaga sp. sic0106]
MTQSPLVSIIIAVYNGARFLQEQLDSVLNQTYSNLEIIAVDDCSTDSSFEILQRYQDRYPNFHVFRNEANLGYIKNFEKGLQLAKGEYMALCDQDDIWLPEKVSIMMAEMAKGYHTAFCDSEVVDFEGKSLGRCISDGRNQQDFDTPLNFAIGNSISGHAMLIRKGVIDQSIPFPNTMIHDRWIAFVATFFGPIRYIDQPLVKYRQHDTNVNTGNKDAKKARKRAEKKISDAEVARHNMELFYQKCPPGDIKAVFEKLNRAYQHPTLLNRFVRMNTFFKYQHEILAFKRRSAFRRFLFCIKTFVKVV